MKGNYIPETEPNTSDGQTSGRKNKKLSTIARATCSIQMFHNLRREIMKASIVSNITQTTKTIPPLTRITRRNTFRGLSTGRIKISPRSKNLRWEISQSCSSTIARSSRGTSSNTTNATGRCPWTINQKLSSKLQKKSLEVSPSSLPLWSTNSKRKNALVWILGLK